MPLRSSHPAPRTSTGSTSNAGTVPPVHAPFGPRPLQSSISHDSAYRSCRSSAQLQPSSSESGADVALRSMRGMQGLLPAELGSCMVAFDQEGNGSYFREGDRIALAPMSPGGGTFSRTSSQPSTPDSLSAPESTSSHRQHCSSANMIPRDDTILNFGKSSARTTAELKSLLGNDRARLKPGAVVAPSQHKKDDKFQGVSLEQAKARARVEVDIVLESDTCVQGGDLRGHIKVRVRRRAKKETPILLGDGKLRLLGFESIPNEEDRHTFYQRAAPLSEVTPASHCLYETTADADGFAQAVEGLHVLPFVLNIPMDGAFGTPKGVVHLNSGITVRYIAMISLKVKDAGTGKRSIAHFYRACEVWPRLDPCAILSSAPRPLHASTSKKLSPLGGAKAGKVHLSAQLHRLHWLAGQRCPVNVSVANETKKTIKSLTLTLVRTATVFKPRPALDAEVVSLGEGDVSDPDACQTSTTHKAVAETTLEMGHRSVRGHASAKGWWTGVGPGQDLEFTHLILLPPDALSITRGRLLEVEYSLRVTLRAGSLSSDVYVTLPLRIINFMSIDPPPAPSFGIPGSLSDTTDMQSHRDQGDIDLTSPWSAFSGSGFEEVPGSGPPRSIRMSFRTSSRSALRIANPDVTDSSQSTTPEQPLTESYSAASVYSTDSSLSTSSSFDIEREIERNLGDFDLAAHSLSDFDSDAEVDAVLDSAAAWHGGDEGYESQFTSGYGTGRDGGSEREVDGQDLPERGRSIGPRPIPRPRPRPGARRQTTFALRVQEKLVAVAQNPGSRTWQSNSSSSSENDDEGNGNEEEEDEEEEIEATPRVGYTAPAPTPVPNPHHRPNIDNTKRPRESDTESASTAPTQRRASRILPQPPIQAQTASVAAAPVPAPTQAQMTPNMLPHPVPQTRTISAPSTVSPSASEVSLPDEPQAIRDALRPRMRRPMSEAGSGSIITSDDAHGGGEGVAGRIAALEQKMRVAQVSGDAYV